MTPPRDRAGFANLSDQEITVQFNPKHYCRKCQEHFVLCECGKEIQSPTIKILMEIRRAQIQAEAALTNRIKNAAKAAIAQAEETNTFHEKKKKWKKKNKPEYIS